MKIHFTLYLLLVGPFLLAQQNGLILDDAAYEAVEMVKKPAVRGKIPTKIDLRPHCPVPGDQGDLPSCVAWTLANTLTIQEAIHQDKTTIEEIEALQYSVAYIYNQITPNGDCYSGARFNDALELLKTRGDCPEQSLSYSQDCNPRPRKKHHLEAFPNRISGYKKIFSSSADADTKIDNALDELAQNRPVIIAMKVPYTFRNQLPKIGEEWRAEDPHAMVVVGYNEYTENFIIMNSYGPEWGDSGFFQIDFETFGKHVRYGFVLLKE